MNTGLTKKQSDTLLTILNRYSVVDDALLFGSRAKGNFKPGSDIDLAVKGKDITRRTVACLNADFEGSDLPYFVDVVHYDRISNAALREHIDRVGIPLNTINTDKEQKS